MHGRSEQCPLRADAPEIRGCRLDAANARDVVASPLDPQAAANAAVWADGFAEDVQADLFIRPACGRSFDTLST